MSRRFGLCALACVILLAMPGRDAQATLTVLPALTQLSRRADLVVAVEVESTSARWEHGRIVTHAQVRVVRHLRGSVKPQRLLVTLLGGVVDGVAMRVIGAPRLTTGERVVLFLVQRGTAHRIVGLDGGKLALERDATGIERVRVPGRSEPIPLDRFSDELEAMP